MSSVFKHLFIETSALCNLKCEMCPTLNYKDGFGLMKEGIYRKIIDDLKPLAYIGLEGWGEPLLDKNLGEHIRLAKTKAETVTFTTNATLITPEKLEEFEKSRLDAINISFDGTNSLIYEKIRKNANFDAVYQRLQWIRESSLRLFLTFVITRINAHQAVEMLDFAQELGVDELYMKPIDVVSSKDVFSMMLDPGELINTYGKVESVYRQGNYSFKLFSWNIYPELKPKDNCLANPLDYLFINYQGEVSPCCNLGHPVPRCYEGEGGIECIENSFLSYGNVMNENIYDIWNKKEYQEFRNKISKKLCPEECRHCLLF